MEIFECHEVMVTSLWVALSIALVVAFSTMAVIAHSNNYKILLIICLTFCIAAIVMLFFVPTEVPNGQMSYTVEITDPTQYKILIEKGYTFKQLFETKEIYTIVGEVLP